MNQFICPLTLPLFSFHFFSSIDLISHPLSHVTLLSSHFTLSIFSSHFGFLSTYLINFHTSVSYLTLPTFPPEFSFPCHFTISLPQFPNTICHIALPLFSSDCSHWPTSLSIPLILAIFPPLILSIFRSHFTFFFSHHFTFIQLHLIQD